MKTLRVLLAVLPLAAQTLHAQLVADGATNVLSNVTNTFTSDVIVGTNGSFTLLVLSDNALLTNSAAGQIGLNATAKSNEVRLISPTARWQTGNGFVVGNSGASSRLVVSNGASVEGNASIVGFNSASTNNSALVTGSGSIWTNRGDLTVGSSGSGNQLVVSNGGRVASRFGYVSLQSRSSNSLVVVSGNGSVWTNQLDLEFAYKDHSNRMIIEAGGAVYSDNGRIAAGGDLVFGTIPLYNEVLVTGPGSLWSNRSAFDFNNALMGGFNRLVVSNGAAVVSGGTGAVGGSGNQTVITGAGSRWANQSSFTLGGSANQLELREGAGLVCSNATLGSLFLGGDNTVLVTGAGSSWTNRGDLTMGFANAVRTVLVVSNGAFASVGRSASIGPHTNANFNNVSVTDPGTVWSISSGLLVGTNGAFNRLMVSNGATVFVGGESLIGGNSSGRANSVIVTDPGTSLTALGLDVGDNNASLNQLIVTNGGQVGARISSLHIGNGGTNNLVVVTGPGSLITNRISLIVGVGGNGHRLVITNGGQVQNRYGTVGLNGLDNEAVVTGAGSLWNNFEELAVGTTGSTRSLLVVTNSGTAAAGTNIFVGTFPLAPARNRMVVDGGILTVTNVLGTGKLDVRAGTNVFNAGLIAADLLFLTNTLGFFEFNGGTLITRGAVVSNGLAFTIGGGATPAVWDVRAGVTDHFLASDLRVGNNSSLNQLLVTNGALLRNNFGILGVNAGGSNNIAVLAGAGSVWTNASDLYVGRSGSGNQLIISNGAAVRNNDGYLSVNAGSRSNLVVVTGLGSVWSNAGALFLGDADQGNRLVVSDGGLIRSSFGYFGVNTASSNNLALVSGSGSLWTNSADLNVGSSGSRNQLIVSNGAVVSVNGRAVLGVNSTSTNNRVVVDNATLRVTNAAANAVFEIRRGTNVLNAGLIEADILRMTNTQGRMEFNSGTLAIKSSRVSIGNPPIVGDGANPATLHLAGNGTHDFTGTLGLIATNNSTLTGNGSLLVQLQVRPGATLSPGASVGKISLSTPPFLSGTTLMEISKSGAVLTNDQLQVTGTLTYGGALVVSNLGPAALAAGDSFKLFNASSYAGSFTSLTLPPLAPPLFWKNNLLTDGSIEVSAPPAIALSSGSYTQSFDALAFTGSTIPWRDNSTLLGWYAAQSVAPTNITDYLVSDGSGISGSLYSFGTTGAPERALGSIGSGSVGTIAYGLCFTNDIGVGVSNFVFTFTGEQWRNASSLNSNALTFWYRVGSTALTNPEPGALTNWTQVTNLGFVSPTVSGAGAALDGNQATNRETFSSVLISGLSVPAGENVFFRWRDVDDTGTDQGIALDDLIVSFSELPADRFWTNALGGIYDVASNWFAHLPPGPEDNANFTNDASYRVTWVNETFGANAYFNARSGIVTQSIGGAAWRLTDSYIVGASSGATAAVIHVDGELQVENDDDTARFSIGEGGRGAFTLKDGFVSVSCLLATNGTASQFTFSGGQLQSRNTTISNGDIFIVGDGVSPASLELLGGGTHQFVNGMSVLPNATLEANGTILGSISMSGTLSPGPGQTQLTIAGHLGLFFGSTTIFELNLDDHEYDSIVGIDQMRYGGALIVSSSGGTLAAGDRFPLFSFTNYIATTFDSVVLPPLGPGLQWRNKLSMDGSIEVLTIPTRDFGVDVSHFQGANGVSQASWNQMFAEGKRFVFIKATEGLTGPHDAAMSNNVERATAAGLLAGVYHFAHPENRPTTNGAILEASNMVVYAGSAIGSGRLRPVLDIEGNAASLSTAALTDWVIAFSDEIVARRGPGAKPIIYCSQSFANFEFDSRLANYDLWLRTIGGSDPAVDDPVNALGFDPTGVFNDWSFWQYSDTGSSGGISPLDLDVCHSEYKSLASYLIPSPPPSSIQIAGIAMSSGSFQFNFTNTPGALFTALAATNITAPLNEWLPVGAIIEISPGQFQFTDPQLTNHVQRYFRIRSP